MKNLKYKITTLAGIFSIALIAVACDDDRGYDDYDAGGTPTEALNGEWYIDISDATGTVLAQHTLHKTFDTNNGDGTMYISDRVGSSESFTGYYLESQVNTDVQNLTFSASGAANTSDGSIVNITEGKILKGAARSRSGVVTDSIYFKGEFDYDPGTVIIFAGHKRTGFEEDDF